MRGLGIHCARDCRTRYVENKATSKIRAVAEQFTDLNIAVVGAPRDGALVRQRMEQLNIGLRNEVGALHGYGAMRNLGASSCGRTSISIRGIRRR